MADSKEEPKADARKEPLKRGMTLKRDDSWKKIQQRTFTNWFNDRLRGNLKVAKRQVKDLETDLEDGLLLVDLLNKLESASGKNVGRYNQNPKIKAQRIENLGAALRFITAQNIKLVNIGPEDIHDGNLKLILGLIWTLISHYQIKSSGRGLSTRKAMLAWINTVIPEYHIDNFSTKWNDGRAVCGMVDHIRPGTCPNHFALNTRDGIENCRLGMDLAEQHLDIPKVLSPEDLNNPDVDDLSVMTYVSYFCNPANQQLLQWIRKKIPQRNVKNLSTDWNNGINLGALSEACFPGICPDWERMEPTNALQNLQKMIQLIKNRLGLECPVSADELANPKVDEIVVATYLSQFRNAKLQASPEQFSLRAAKLPHGSGIVREPLSLDIEVSQEASSLVDDIKVTAHGPSSDVGVTLKPKKGDTLEATFVPTEGGSYQVFAVYGNDHIQGSPMSVPVADPSKCQIFGDIPTDLQVGRPEDIIVKTRGAGIGKMTCTFGDSDESSTPLIDNEIEEKENDTFEVKLIPKAIGEAVVGIKWAGEFVPKCPLLVNICDASKCSVVGDALTSGAGKVGEPVNFTLSAKDAGKGKPDVKPRGPSALYTPEIKDNEDGTYDISFTPWEVGPHKIDVMWGGGHVPKSPFSMNIKSAPDANTCSVTGRGLKHAIAGQETHFTILSPEKGLLEKDGLLVQVASLQDNAPVNIKDNNDGTYEVTYTAPVPGAYITTIKFYDKNIPGSPFKLDVVPAPDASKCRAYGPALHPNSLHIAGTPLDLYVDTKKAGTGELQVIVKGPDDTRPKVFTANDKGVYSLKFDIPDAGRYSVNVWWSRVHIPGSPFKLRVHPGPNAAMVKAYGPGLEEALKVGEPAKFTVETKNAGIGTLTIRVHGIKGAFKIECNPASETDVRTLLGNYAPKAAGEYLVTIRWSGVQVPGSPFHIHIVDPDESKKKKTGKKHGGDPSQESLVLPEDVDSPNVQTTAGGIPVMTKEQARLYQHRMLQERRLYQAGMRPQPGYPYPMNPAFIQSGGVAGFASKLKANPSFVTDPSAQKLKPGSAVRNGSPTKASKKDGKGNEVRIKEEPDSAAYVGDSSDSKAKKKKMKL